MTKASRPSNADSCDRRAQERQTMILRVGLLEQHGKASFCLIRNVSPGGIKVRLYSSGAHRGDVLVRVADEEPIAGHIVWIKNTDAGISFENGIDPATLLRLQQKLTSSRRRSMPRIKAASCAALRVGGRTVQAVLQDISSMGARVATSRSLQVGARAFIKFPDLPELTAYVRWAENLDSGLVFETPIPIRVISQWIDGRLRVIA
jgi:PilZ domain